MSVEPTLEEGKRYRGLGTFEGVEGICVGTSETGFGFKYADIKTDAGEVLRCRSHYFSEVEVKPKKDKGKKRTY